MDKKFKTIIIVGLALLTAWLYISIKNSSEKKLDHTTFYATVENILSEETIDNEFQQSKTQEILVSISDEKYLGKEIVIKNDENSLKNGRTFKKGDKVMLTMYEDQNGGEIFYISDYIRHRVLLWLFGLFALVVVVVTRWQGLGSFLGMGISFAVIFKIVLPLILNGINPVFSAIVGSIIIIPSTFYFSHGVNKKTTVAVIGTLITLVVTGLLAMLFAKIGHLTGLASEEIIYLKIEASNLVDFSGLVIAGMMIGILGILDDITISQSSTVQQLKNAKSSIQFTELYKRGMTVGRDHIASMVNTLVLIYAGASLPLLLVFMNHSEKFSEVINYEFIAQEVIQTFVGSIGLILAVPITTLLACLMLKKTDEKIHSHAH